MLPAKLEVDARGRDFGAGALAGLRKGLPRLRDGDLVAVLSDQKDVTEALLLWAEITGNAVVDRTEQDGVARLVIRKGRPVMDAVEESDDEKRVWIYTNFHCNLACDYCCVGSSPTAAPREVPLEAIGRLAREAREMGRDRIYMTGGEPFIRKDIREAILAAAEELPVTVLTNAMLFKGQRLEDLKALPRDRVTLQVSLDSPTPELHDKHRGIGSWQRAREGIALARSLGFRVRIAATCASEEDRRAMDDFLAGQGVPEPDRVIRPIAQLGEASDNEEAVAFSRAEIVPEPTATAEGWWWHPVGAGEPSFRVTEGIRPLTDVMVRIEAQREEDVRTSNAVASVFHCA